MPWPPRPGPSAASQPGPPAQRQVSGDPATRVTGPLSAPATQRTATRQLTGPARRNSHQHDPRADPALAHVLQPLRELLAHRALTPRPERHSSSVRAIPELIPVDSAGLWGRRRRQVERIPAPAGCAPEFLLVWTRVQVGEGSRDPVGRRLATIRGGQEVACGGHPPRRRLKFNG